MSSPAGAPSAPPGLPDPLAILRTRSYQVLLVLGGVLGVPVAVVAYFFLQGVARLQTEIYKNLPISLGFHGAPIWWPLPWLALCGALVAISVVYLPGTSGHEPSEGLNTGGPVDPVNLFGVVAAAFATLSLGAVLGPEAPLIAIGSGMGVLAVHLLKRDAPAQAVLVIGAAGSFAAISALLGSPLVAAFLLMEMSGLGGPMMEIVLLPGLLAAGVGSLVFVGLNSMTGLGTFSLAVTGIPAFGSPTLGEFLWAIGIGVGGALLASVIFRIAKICRRIIEGRRLLLTPVAGLAIAGIAMAFEAGTGRGSTTVLFSGQSALPALVQHAAGWTVGALLLLMLCKGLAYSVSLGGFRGGPIFPSMFLGAAGGIALSHLPGLPLMAGVAMGVGAVIAGALKMPLTAVLLPSVMFVSDSIPLMPLVIVAVVVSYIVSTQLAAMGAQHPDAQPASTPHG